MFDSAAFRVGQTNLQRLEEFLRVYGLTRGENVTSTSFEFAMYPISFSGRVASSARDQLTCGSVSDKSSRIFIVNRDQPVRTHGSVGN